MKQLTRAAGAALFGLAQGACATQAAPPVVVAQAEVRLPDVECPGAAPLQHEVLDGSTVRYWCGDDQTQHGLFGESVDGQVKVELRYIRRPDGQWDGTLRRPAEHSEVNFRGGEPQRCAFFSSAPSLMSLDQEHMWAGGHVRLIKRYRDGKLLAEEERDAEGRRHGVERTFNANGDPSFEAHYVAGQLDGRMLIHRENGSRASEAWYSAGFRHGKSVVWDSNDVQRFEGSYSRGVRHGRFAAWTASGWQTDDMTVESGTGPMIEVDAEGRITRRGTIVKDHWHGDFEDYDASGVRRVAGRFRADVFDGAFVYYDKEGDVSLKGRYVLGSPVGTWESFHANGTRFERGAVLPQYGERVVRQGTWQTWSADGALSSERTFNAGKLDPPPAANCYTSLFHVTEGRMTETQESADCPRNAVIAR